MLIMRCSQIDSGSANQTFSSNKGSSQIDIQNEIFEGNLKLCFNGLILTVNRVKFDSYKMLSLLWS